MEERSIKIDLDTAIEWYKSYDSTLKKLSLQAFSKEELECDYESILDTLILENRVSKKSPLIFTNNLPKLLAYSKLMNIALYLNKGRTKGKMKRAFFICYLESSKRFEITSNETITSCNIHFKSEEVTRRAIELMGEESLKDLFEIE